MPGMYLFSLFETFCYLAIHKIANNRSANAGGISVNRPFNSREDFMDNLDRGYLCVLVE